MSSETVEETTRFEPKFGADGLLMAFVVDAANHAPLMAAHMNREALDRTLASGEAHFWSRSRQELWHKGATSGNVLQVREMRVDCDQDVLWLAVEIAGHGAACHTGRQSCFYRLVEAGEDAASSKLVLQNETRMFDPELVYKA